MNICLLTDDQKSYVFEEDREYTDADILDLSVVATANRTFVKTLLSYYLDTNTSFDRDHLVDLLNILKWLSEPLTAFFLETGLWENLPEHMKIAKENEA